MRLIFTFSIVLLFCSCGLKSNNSSKQKLPNILIFVGDDMNWNDCEPYGSEVVKTPNIQKLANEGMSFDNMFTSTAMCAPTRQQLMTGLYPVRSGAFPNHSVVYDGVKSFAHHFGELGYEVALIGKNIMVLLILFRLITLEVCNMTLDLAAKTLILVKLNLL
jgi:uncharacterized sulfatase